MIRRRLSFSSLVAFVAFVVALSATSPTAAIVGVSEPKLVRAELSTHTNNDNKDHDTGIYVKVTTQDGASLLAQILNAYSSSDGDATVYNDHSDHILKLTIEDPGAKKSDCNGFTVRMAIQAHGTDDWRLNAQVVLYFSDGTNLIAKEDGFALHSDSSQLGDEHVFSAPNAVATSSKPEPTLVFADLLTHTKDDNKDKDTGIYVTVTTRNEASLLAQIVSADSSADDATEYNDGSDHDVALVVENVGAKKSDCKGFEVSIAIRTTGGLGHDTWKFDALVILTFSDGTNLIAQKKGINLTNGSVGLGDPVVFNAPAPASATASAS
jgi:hypothetical protein